MKTIMLPASVEFIYNNPFIGCDSLIELSVLGNNPIYKSENNCIIRKSDNILVASCKSSTIPICTKGIGDYAFYDCELDEIALPSNVETIGRSSLSSSTIKKVIFSENLKEIGVQAFANCKNIRNVVIPQGVKKIGAYAFENDYFLSVTLPSTVQTIEVGALSWRCK